MKEIRDEYLLVQGTAAGLIRTDEEGIIRDGAAIFWRFIGMKIDQVYGEKHKIEKEKDLCQNKLW